MSENTRWLNEIRWDENGLVPVIAQEASSGDVLMFAWMNREALQRTADSDRDVVNVFNGFLAAPEYVPNAIKSHTLQTASHFLLGAEVELFRNMSTRLEGWYKNFTQLLPFFPLCFRDNSPLFYLILFRFGL